MKKVIIMPACNKRFCESGAVARGNMTRFFKYNILLDIIILLIIFCLLAMSIFPENTICFKIFSFTFHGLIYSPLYFLLRFVFMLLQLFRYKKIEVRKTITYSVVLIITTIIVWYMIFYVPFVVVPWIYLILQ